MNSAAELFEAIEGAVEAVISRKASGIHTALPGIVERFEAGVVDVKPSVAIIDENGDAIELPVIVGVPVMYQKSGEFSVTFPLVPGDTVLLVFCEASIEGFIETGGDSTQEDRRRHSLTDAVAIPGLYGGEKGKPVSDWNVAAIQYGKAAITIDKAGAVDINGGALRVTL